MNQIPKFNSVKATEFILNHKLPYVKLLYKRDIEGVSINDSEFIELQEKLLPERSLSRLMEKQLESGAWQPPDKDDVFGPMQRSTVWTLILLGGLGLNGSVLPNVSKAVDYIFEKQFNKEEKIFVNDHPIWGKFMQSHNSTILRALIKLEFESRDDVKEASFIHLEKIHGQEGFCPYKKGDFRCAWGLAKDLLFFNEWPEAWRNQQYTESVKACQEYLLAYDLATAAYPRAGKYRANHKWFDFSYFKTYYSDYFEVVEVLVESGIKSHLVLTNALKAVGEKCIDEQTWKCELARNWIVKFEKLGEYSPWLSLRGLRINKALS